MPSPLAVVSPGKRMHANSIVPDVSITLGNYKFLSSPTVLGDSDIDLILGMDWLSKHKAQLDCAARQIHQETVGPRQPPPSPAPPRR